MNEVQTYTLVIFGLLILLAHKTENALKDIYTRLQDIEDKFSNSNEDIEI